jgi:alpha-mannosidase
MLSDSPFCLFLLLSTKDLLEQIQNGGATIILKDDGKTVNNNDYIDKPTTNKKEKNKNKSGKTKKKKRQKEKNR